MSFNADSSSKRRVLLQRLDEDLVFAGVDDFYGLLTESHELANYSNRERLISAGYDKFTVLMSSKDIWEARDSSSILSIDLELLDIVEVLETMITRRSDIREHEGMSSRGTYDGDGGGRDRRRARSFVSN